MVEHSFLRISFYLTFIQPGKVLLKIKIPCLRRFSVIQVIVVLENLDPGQLDFIVGVEDNSPLTQEASSVLTDWGANPGI